MKPLRLLISLVFVVSPLAVRALEPWQSALERMPLGTNVSELNRSNGVQIMLRALGSNDVVKALIFQPGATDEFYMFRRARAFLTNAQPTLWDAVNALTNQTRIRATFHAPLLLLHTDEDPLEPLSEIQHLDTAARIARTRFVPHLVSYDRDWDYLLPILQKSHRIPFTPKLYSRSSFHFYRHSFAAWNLDGWEALEAIALAGKTQFTVGNKQVAFEADKRIKATPM